MNHPRAQALIDWIHARQLFGKKNGLDNMTALLGALNDPHKNLRIVHVAGTNGKGSVCAMIECALGANGLKTGMYTSPFLCHYRERISFSGQSIDEDAFVRAGERVRRIVDALPKGIVPTAFELGTAIAFCAFEEAHVEFAVIETGLGGRLDATNVVWPQICVITNIALDHVEYLGDTVEKIAWEKAGVIKPDVPCVLYPAEKCVKDVFESVACSVGAQLIYAQDTPIKNASESMCGASFQLAMAHWGTVGVSINLPGAHQVENARLAMIALEKLALTDRRIDRDACARGLEQTIWPGRLEWIKDNILLDGAHNPQGADVLCNYVRRFLAGRKIVLVTAMMQDKQPEAFVHRMAGVIDLAVVTQLNMPRALNAQPLAGLYAQAETQAITMPDASSALEYAHGCIGENGIILVAGSLYLVGETRSNLRRISKIM